MSMTTGIASTTMPASSTGVMIDPGTVNSKGAWFELTSATPFDAWGFFLQAIYGISIGVNDDFLLDIGIGGSGAETVLLANVPLGLAGTRGDLCSVFVPLEIPSGTRVSARIQQSSTSSSDAVFVKLLLFEKSTQSGASSAQTYGANTADSGGVLVDPGATLNTKGAWSEITPATSADINWLLLFFGNQDNSARSSCGWIFDVAIGAASSEVIAVADIPTWCSSGTGVVFPPYFTIPIPTIPSGTRLSVRCACSINNFTDRLLDVVIIGLNVPL